MTYLTPIQVLSLRGKSLNARSNKPSPRPGLASICLIQSTPLNPSLMLLTSLSKMIALSSSSFPLGILSSKAKKSLLPL